MKTLFDKSSECEIHVTRGFDASRQRIWEMYTQAEHLKHWWGPEGWTLPVCELDFRLGGVWFYCMAGPDDMTSCGKATYLEIDPPRRLVYTDAFADADGRVLDSFPEAHITVEFSEDDGRTTVLSVVRYDTQEQRDQIVEMGAEAGIDQTLDRLEAYLESAG
ncbi:MAG: SRPBCC domain-containing protein [Chloroflexi bacterium]|nr:SRPBCC domain-containing protein [Chloroflexota bacterium]